MEHEPTNLQEARSQLANHRWNPYRQRIPVDPKIFQANERTLGIMSIVIIAAISFSAVILWILCLA